MTSFVLAIRLSHDHSANISMNFVFIVLVIYTWGCVILAANMMSSLWEKSYDYIREFNISIATNDGVTPSKELAAIAKSLFPLRFAVGGIYYMDKSAKLSLIAFLISGTTNFLLTFE